MGLFAKLLFILALFKLLKCHEATQRVIYVEKSPNATDSPSCYNGSKALPCKSLNYAFKGVVSDTLVQIGPGNYSLMADNTEFANLSNVTILGSGNEGSNRTLLLCDYDQAAGLSFVRSTDITISHLMFSLCGALRNSTSVLDDSNSTARVMSSVYFHNCTSVTIDTVSIHRSNGTGMTMYSLHGEVNLLHSVFTENSVVEAKVSSSGGGGVYIEFPFCPPGIASGPECGEARDDGATIIIDNCTFSHNKADVAEEYKNSFTIENGTSHIALGRGGGLSITVAGNARENHFSVVNCTFTKNMAVWGAGLFAQFQDSVSNNSLVVAGSHFDSNSLPFSVKNRTGTGGGGVRVGFVFYDRGTVTHNSVVFDHCTFERNRAYWGGGVSFYSPRQPGKFVSDNTLSFNNCRWVQNVARLGSAIDLGEFHTIIDGSLPVVAFTNCSFCNNSFYYYYSGRQLLNWQYLLGRGAVYTDSIPLQFEGTSVFTGNSGSALAVLNTYITFEEGSHNSFIANFGMEGGAIALLGNAFALTTNQSVLVFEDNYAYRLGGAIYAINVGGHDLVSSRNCFLHYTDYTIPPFHWPVFFLFKNNTAEIAGNSIYTTSLLPCMWGDVNGPLNTSLSLAREVFRWINVFEYDNCSQSAGDVDAVFNCTVHEIASDLSDVVSKANLLKYPAYPVANQTDVVVEPIVTFTPGKQTQLPFDLFDDVNNTVQAVFYARISCDDSMHDSSDCGIYVSKATVYSSFLIVTIKGQPRDVATNASHLPTLTLNSLGTLEYQICVKVNLTCCPPGFFLETDHCECADSGKRKISGITGCDFDEFEAFMSPNYWAGYFDSNLEYASDSPCRSWHLYLSICPHLYCSFTPGNTERRWHLPSNASNQALSDLLCDNRSGVLCSECKAHYSVAINGFGTGARCINCSASISTSYAWLVWVLTEVVPVTVVLFSFLLFDFKILSGPLNAFLLYAQVVEYFGLHAFGQLDLLKDSAAEFLVRLYHCLYGFWNLQFLGAFLNPYCIAENMTTFHYLVFQYAIAVYPFILLIAFFSAKRCIEVIGPCYRATQRVKYMFIRCQRLWKTRSNIVNGLAAFMVLSYSKIAVVSFSLLATTSLNSEDGLQSIHVVRFQGNFKPFQGDHLPYAILAAVMIVTVVAIPPLLLLFYPLFPRIYERANLGRYRFFSKLNRLNNRFLANGLLPAFQGCYQHKYGFFAGVLFLFRIFFLAAFAVAWNVETMFVWNAAISLALLLFHAVLQPYENRLINILDTFMYTNMVLINLISLYSLYAFQDSGAIHPTAFYIQLLLIYAPMGYITGWIVFSLVRAFRKCYIRGKDIKFYRQVPRSNSDPQVSFDKSARRDSGGLEDMSNPPTINRRSTSSNPTNYLQRDAGLDYETSGSFWEHQSLLRSKSRHTNANRHEYSSTDHAEDFPVTVSTVEVGPPSRR